MFDNLLLSYGGCFTWRKALPVRPAAKLLFSILPPYWRYKRFSIEKSIGLPVQFVKRMSPKIRKWMYWIREDITKLHPDKKHWHRLWHCSMSQEIPEDYVLHSSVPLNAIKNQPDLLVEHPRYQPHRGFGITNKINIYNKNARFQDIVDTNELDVSWARAHNIKDSSHDLLLDFVGADNGPQWLFEDTFEVLVEQFCIRPAVAPLFDEFYMD